MTYKDSKGRFSKGHNQSNTGRTHFKKGITAWNKGKKNHWTTKRNLKDNPAKKLEVKKKIREAHLGKPLSKKTRKKMSKSHKGKHTAENSNFWKGGITPLNKKIRSSEKYKIWRSKVFERDNWTCQTCNVRGGGVYLEAHHSPKTFSQIIKVDGIKTFEQALKYKKLWDINNGITLCFDCHNITKKGGQRNYGFHRNKPNRLDL